MIHRTRIKMCGFTQKEDIVAACALGCDAIGFVLYPQSPRAVSLEHLRTLITYVPSFVTPVLLFVNASSEEIMSALACAPHALLQFHGDEPLEECLRYKRPFLRAIRVPSDAPLDLLQYQQEYAQAQGLLFDTWSSGYGGSGHCFDWNLVNANSKPHPQAPHIILSGGLTPDNVADGIQKIRPWAVDVSSGIEKSKGIKEVNLMQAFIQAVKQTDECITSSLLQKTASLTPKTPKGRSL